MSRKARTSFRQSWLVAGGCILLFLAVLGIAWSVRSSKWIRRESTTPALTSPPAIEMARLPEPDPIVVRAVEDARAAVIREPRSSPAWGRLGMMLLVHGAAAQSSNVCFAQAELLDPREPRWPYFQGISLLESKPDAAIVKLERAAELCGERPDTPRLKLAETLLARGRLEEAESQFRRCLQAHAGHPRALLGLGRLAYLRGDLQAAEKQLSGAASDPRTETEARALLAEIRYKTADREQAVRWRAELGQMRPDPPWFDPFMEEAGRLEVGRKRKLTAATALIRAQRVKEAIALLQQTLAEYPDSERTRLLLGLAYNTDKNWTEGEKVLRQAAANTPQAPRVHYNLGLAIAAQNRFAEAAAAFQKAAQLMPNDAVTHFRLGRCQVQLGEANAAERAFRMALDCMPAFADAHRELGDLLGKSGRHEEARTHLNQALKLNPRDAEAARMLAEMELQDSSR